MTGITLTESTIKWKVVGFFPNFMSTAWMWSYPHSHGRVAMARSCR